VDRLGPSPPDDPVPTALALRRIGLLRLGARRKHINNRQQRVDQIVSLGRVAAGDGEARTRYERAECSYHTARGGCISGRQEKQVDLLYIGEDLAADIGAKRSTSGWEVFYARSALVTHAAAYGLQAIDMVNIDFQDIPALRVQATQGLKMGFTGKQVIHPNQVKPVQQTFTPSDEQIRDAQTIVEAFNAHQAEGRGAFAENGKMIDAPLIKSAQALLERARAAGKI